MNGYATSYHRSSEPANIISNIPFSPRHIPFSPRKLADEIAGDAEKLFTYWDKYGWQRATFYGNLREPAQELAKALKLRFAEEA